MKKKKSKFNTKLTKAIKGRIRGSKVIDAPIIFGNNMIVRGFNKSQEKRFEKWYLEVTDTRKWKDGKPVVGGYMYVTFGNAVKQFIAQELDIQRKGKEKPDPDGPLGWIMTLNNQGELTVHMSSVLSHRIQKAFDVKHEKNVFVTKDLIK